MNNFIEERARALEVEAAALRASQRKVTVELSLPIAWLLRDMIGLHGLGNKVGVSTQADLDALNKAVGYRAESSSPPHVSHWSGRQSGKVMHND